MTFKTFFSSLAFGRCWWREHHIPSRWLHLGWALTAGVCQDLQLSHQLCQVIFRTANYANYGGKHGSIIMSIAIRFGEKVLRSPHFPNWSFCLATNNLSTWPGMSTRVEDGKHDNITARAEEGVSQWACVLRRINGWHWVSSSGAGVPLLHWDTWTQ